MSCFLRNDLGDTPLICRNLILGICLAFVSPVIGQDADAESKRRNMPPSIAAIIDHYQAKEFRDGNGDLLKYRLFTPPEQSPDDKLPLVLFLHGAGERGDDNFMQLVHGASEFVRDDRLRDYPAHLVFPQCPKDKQWVSLPWSSPTGKGTFPDKMTGPLASAIELVQSMIDGGTVDPSRVYVTGLSMGGYGTWAAAGWKPELFAAAAPICGGGDPEWASRYQGIPIWAFHGQSDSVVPATRSREMIAALAGAGHTPELRYDEYPKVNHNSWTRTFVRDDFFAWLFSHRRP